MADQRAVTLGKIIEARTNSSPAYPAPTITAITPNTGVLAGGEVVAVTGTGLSGCSAVFFGDAPGTALSVVDDGEV